MNTIRMIAIALPMMLLLACGGGGGTAVSPTTTPPPTTGDPNMPPTVTLPGYTITNATVARNAVGGTAPTSMSETQIVREIQTRATAADTLDISNFVGTTGVDITCASKSCTGTIPNVNMLTFSLTDIEDLSLVDGDMNLVGFDSSTEAVMVDRGVTLIQSQAAAGQNDGTHLTFQTYGGWLTDSVFGVELLNVTENDTTTPRYASFSFGNDSGTNPSILTSSPENGVDAYWRGVVVGRSTESGNLIQGDLLISMFSDNSNISNITFSSMKNLNTGADLDSIIWRDISMTNGNFRVADESIEGTFYGVGHTEVGGTFNRNSIIGSFGGARRFLAFQ